MPITIICDSPFFLKGERFDFPIFPLSNESSVDLSKAINKFNTAMCLSFLVDNFITANVETVVTFLFGSIKECLITVNSTIKYRMQHPTPRLAPPEQVISFMLHNNMNGVDGMFRNTVFARSEAVKAEMARAEMANAVAAEAAKAEIANAAAAAAAAEANTAQHVVTLYDLNRAISCVQQRGAPLIEMPTNARVVVISPVQGRLLMDVPINIMMSLNGIFEDTVFNIIPQYNYLSFTAGRHSTPMEFSRLNASIRLISTYRAELGLDVPLSRNQSRRGHFSMKLPLNIMPILHHNNVLTNNTAATPPAPPCAMCYIDIPLRTRLQIANARALGNR
jgi:hypothetical protein